ncbi:MAG: hypothetical protein J6B72_05215 [Clostridia bacterium]|nr:hypothetical protein [Clostridia bacterium]
MKTNKTFKAFTVASLNLLNNNNHGIEGNFIAGRMPRIVSFINTEKPDSIGVQECDMGKDRGNMRTAVNEGIAPSGYVCAQEEQWDGTTYAFKNFIWYNSNTTECSDSGQMWLSETPDIPSKGFGAKHYISMGWAVLKNKLTGMSYLHVNTHLYAIGAYTETPEERAAIRLKEADALLAHIGALWDKYKVSSVFLTGDMNEAEGGAVYKKLTEWLEDTRYLAKDTTNRITFHCFGSRSSVIDFCLCSIDKSVVNIDRFDVVEEYEGKLISDHSALLVDVSIKN